MSQTIPKSTTDSDLAVQASTETIRPVCPEVSRTADPIGPSGPSRLGGLCDTIRDATNARSRLTIDAHGRWLRTVDRPTRKRFEGDAYGYTVTLDADRPTGPWQVRVTRHDGHESTVTLARDFTREDAYHEAARLMRQLAGCSTK